MPSVAPTREHPAPPPPWWPRFSSPLRSTALTARVGRLLGITFGICFVTGMLSHYQYHPWEWLPEPASPVWAYRLTQGLHVLTGTITIPLLLLKLWSVYPKLFQRPPVGSLRRAAERASIAILVSSALVELVTGFFNVLNWYPWPWSFVPVHRFLAYVVIGSILLHVAIKLPDIRYGLRTPLVLGDVLTEVPWEQNPDAYSNNDDAHVPPPVPSAITRRGVLTAAAGGIGLVLATMIGQVITPLRGIGLLAVRNSAQGPQGVPVNRTAEQADVRTLAADPGWTLLVTGPDTGFALSLEDVETMATHEAGLPIACVEGWSVGAQWRGLRLIDVVRRAGGSMSSTVRLTSLEPRGSYNVSYVSGGQLDKALLATHLNGSRLDLDHGYPLRLIAPDRAGVLNTKWLSSIEVL